MPPCYRCCTTASRNPHLAPRQVGDVDHIKVFANQDARGDSVLALESEITKTKKVPISKPTANAQSPAP